MTDAELQVLKVRYVQARQKRGEIRDKISELIREEREIIRTVKDHGDKLRAEGIDTDTLWETLEGVVTG